MKQTNLFIALAMVLIGFVATAHEGEDHDKPSTIQAPKGGSIKSLEETHVEVVAKGKDLKIYLYDKDLKPKSVKDFTVSAKAEMPRTKKTETIDLKALEQHFEATYDAKGIHRYTLILAVKDPKTGHDDKLKFIIEPKK